MPGNEEPHDGAAFLAHRLEGPFRRHALQYDRLAADDEAAEPVHLGARVIERRDEDEAVLFRLLVVGVLGHAGAEHVVVGEQNGFRLTRGARGEVEPALVRGEKGDVEVCRGPGSDEFVKGFRPRGTLSPTQIYFFTVGRSPFIASILPANSSSKTMIVGSATSLQYLTSSEVKRKLRGTTQAPVLMMPK